MKLMQGEIVRIREATPADRARLAEIAQTSEVARWWGPDPDLEGMLVIERDGRVVGGITYHEDDDPQYRHAGVDLFVDPAYHRQGIGSDALRTLAYWLIEGLGHHRVTIDPRADNVASIRCAEKAGFRRVGVLREYECDPWTGEWRDGLLMDLLATDLMARDLLSEERLRQSPADEE